jgi:hypothetical protein
MTDGRSAGWIEQSAANWEHWKHGVEALFWYQADSLHVVCGVLLTIFFALVTRKSLASFVPWTLLVLASSVNEGIDIWFTHDVAESVKDTVLTILAPTILLVSARWFPSLYTGYNPAPGVSAID